VGGLYLLIMKKLIRSILRENDNTKIQEIINNVISNINTNYPNIDLTYDIKDNNKTVNFYIDTKDNSGSGKLFDSVGSKIYNLTEPYSYYGKSSLKINFVVRPNEKLIQKFLNTKYIKNLKNVLNDLGIEPKHYFYDFDGVKNDLLDQEIIKRKKFLDANFDSKLIEFIKSKTDVPVDVLIKTDNRFFIDVKIYLKLTLNDFLNCKYKKWFIDEKSFPLETQILHFLETLKLMYSDLRIATEIIWPRDVGSYIVSKNKKLRDSLSKTSQQKVAVRVDYGVCGSKPSFTISWPSNYDINKRNYKSKIIKVIQNEFPNSGPITTSNNYWDTFKSYSTEDRRYWSKEQMFDFFVLQSKNTFGDSYEYDINKFDDLDNLAEVYCKQHERWFDVLPKEHIGGKRCPFDNESKGETMVRVYLEKNNIPFKQYHKLKGCFSEINGRCILLTFDFYLPEQNAVIEYDGEQHYKPVERFGGEPTYQRQVLLDNIKNVFCDKSGVKMIRIPYTIKKPKDIKELLDVQLK
jgi:hypothetical protein